MKSISPPGYPKSATLTRCAARENAKNRTGAARASAAAGRIRFFHGGFPVFMRKYKRLFARTARGKPYALWKFAAC